MTNLEAWLNIFQNGFEKTDPIALVDEIYALENKNIFPEKKNVFKAFELCHPDEVKVVIIGQDPYHVLGQAQGLAFSLPDGAKTQPSMRNILKELKDDLGDLRNSQDLTSWAKQGVLLLNASLTVEEGKPGSMMHLWEDFTRHLLEVIVELPQPIVFILWGNFAKKYLSIIEGRKDVIVSAHPSPFSAQKGFFGSRPFSQTNKILKKYNKEPIFWLK